MQSDAEQQHPMSQVTFLACGGGFAFPSTMSFRTFINFESAI